MTKVAVVKVKTIKSSLGKAIKYITNVEKTESGKLVSSNYASQVDDSERLAELMMQDINSTRFGVRPGTVLGRHVIQSFSPDDHVTPQQAHEIGCAFIEQITGGEYKYVIATHTDRHHIHNHIVICNASDTTHTMLRMQKSTLGKWREISDALCRQNGLQVIRKPKVERHGRSLAEIYAGAKGNGIKDRMRTSLDLAAAHSVTFADFVQRAQRAGVNVQIRGRHLTFTDSATGLKVRDLKLGQAYDERNIMAKISRENVTPISFDKTLIASRDAKSVTVCLPGTRRQQRITLPVARCVHAGRTWRAYIGIDNDQTIVNARGRYERTVHTNDLYEYFSPPQISLSEFATHRLPISVGVSDAQRGYLRRQGHRLDNLQLQANQLAAARKWMRASQGDLKAAIDLLEQRVSNERADFQARVVAVQEAADSGDLSADQALELQNDLDQRDRRLTQLEADLNALRQLQKRSKWDQETQTQNQTKNRVRTRGRRK